MKIRTLVDSRRLAGRTARIGTVRSYGVRRRTSTFPEFCGEEPCRRLGNPQMLKDTHPHLFNVAGTKDSCGDNALRVSSRTKAPRLYGTSLDKNDRSKAPEFVR